MTQVYYIEPNLPPDCPTTLEEALVYLNKLLSAEDRELFKREADSDTLAIELHDTLGRQLRNLWCLWSDRSPLHKHMRGVHKIEHPDDMTRFILNEYGRWVISTRFQRVLNQKL